MHLVDTTAPDRDPVADIRTINRELRRYRSELGDKPQILVLTKADAAQDQERVRRVLEYAARQGTPALVISAVSGQGLTELIRITGERLDGVT